MKRCIIFLFLLPLWLAAQELWCPEPTNRLVNDYSGVLSSQERIELEQRLVAFDDSTSNQILVIILPSLHDCEIMELGTRIGTQWGVGQKDLKNGLVILIKSRDRDNAEDYGDVALLPGYGLEGALPDAFCKHIIDDEMIEPLSEGDYYQAICNALEVIEPVCRGEYSYEQYRREDRRALFVVVGVMLLLAVVCFVLGSKYNENHPNDNDRDNFSDGGGNNWRNRGGPIYWGGIPRGGGGFGGFGGSSGGFGGFGGGSFGGGGAHGRFYRFLCDTFGVWCIYNGVEGMPISAISVQNSFSKGIVFNGQNNGTKRRGVSRYAAPVAATMLVLTPAQTGAVNKGDMFVPTKEHTELVEPNIYTSLNSPVGDTVLYTKKVLLRDTTANGMSLYGYSAFDFVDKDGNPNNFEDIVPYVSFEATNGFKKSVKPRQLASLRQFNVAIMSDDKSVSCRYDYRHLVDSKNMVVADDTRQLKLVEDELYSNRNNSKITIEQYNAFLVPDYKTKSFKAVENISDVPDKYKNAKAIDCSKLNKAGSDVVTGDNGEYELSYYSEKGSNRVQLVTVKKKDYPELAVAENYLINMKISDDDVVKLAMTVLADADHNAVILTDRKLAYMLGKIYMSDIVSKDVFTCGNREQAMCVGISENNKVKVYNL